MLGLVLVTGCGSVHYDIAAYDTVVPTRGIVPVGVPMQPMVAPGMPAPNAAANLAAQAPQCQEPIAQPMSLIKYRNKTVIKGGLFGSPVPSEKVYIQGGRSGYDQGDCSVVYGVRGATGYQPTSCGQSGFYSPTAMSGGSGGGYGYVGVGAQVGGGYGYQRQ